MKRTASSRSSIRRRLKTTRQDLQSRPGPPECPVEVIVRNYKNLPLSVPAVTCLRRKYWGLAGPKLLVVTFASAPGVPNWGGVLSKLAAKSTPAEKDFDIFFVCDGGRTWYSGNPSIPIGAIIGAPYTLGSLSFFTPYAGFRTHVSSDTLTESDYAPQPI